MILSKSMSCILQLATLLVLPFLVTAGVEESGIYKAHNIQKVHYLASKYTPTFVPCKYGVELAFDQAHFVPLPVAPFTRTRKCPSGSETMTVKLSGRTKTKVIVCCLPETPWKHLKTVSLTGGSGPINADGIVANLGVTHTLNVVFPDIVPKYNRTKDNKTIVPKAEASEKKKEPKKKPDEQRFSMTSFGCFLMGAAVAQIIVLALILFTMFVSRGRIELDAPPDCDYTIMPEVRTFNPSKSGMMSENMNSDLMSMSQGAL